MTGTAPPGMYPNFALVKKIQLHNLVQIDLDYGEKINNQKLKLKIANHLEYSGKSAFAY